MSGVREELADRYGELPEPVLALLRVSQLRRTHRPVQPGPPVDTVEICDGGCAER